MKMALVIHNTLNPYKILCFLIMLIMNLQIFGLFVRTSHLLMPEDPQKINTVFDNVYSIVGLTGYLEYKEASNGPAATIVFFLVYFIVWALLIGMVVYFFRKNKMIPKWLAYPVTTLFAL